jgi:hypothetical protein
MRNRLAAFLAFGAFGPLAACGGGGGSPAGNAVPHPLVRQFSPTMSPIDLQTLQANPTFTDGTLEQSTDPAYPGKIVVFFQEDTEIDPNSVFVGGNPSLGIDLSALQILQYVPGTGNIPVEAAPNGVEVLHDRIIFTPAVIAAGGRLPDGQYSIGVFANLKNTEGDAVQKTPVFHSFTVGEFDSIAPVVVVTNPPNGATGVGAGIPPPPPPAGLPATSIADVRTTIFGAVSPDVTIRFSEAVEASTINPNTIQVIDAGANVIPPPTIPPEPTFPKLKSQLDGASLPSNGFEVVWRASRQVGGLPFGTQVQVKVVGLDGGTNPSPITDRSGNALQASYVFQFQTIAPPKFPENPEPEYAIYYSTSDRVGVIDCVNQKEIAQVFLGSQTTPIIQNVRPEFSDTIATKATLGVNFDPNEISVDARTDFLSCHTFIYVQSNQSGQIVIINTRTSLPVALINTPSPGGLSNQTGGGTAANVLMVTNSSANTITTFQIGGYLPGRQFLTGPIHIHSVRPTGNTPRAISISAPPSGAFNREFFGAGPATALVLYADFSDGVVNTARLSGAEPVKEFALGVESAPNDLVMTGCFLLNNTPTLFAAISQGGSGGEGKVAVYLAGPGCTTGQASPSRPDTITGTISGLDAPAGLDNIFAHNLNLQYFFAVAESGANRVHTMGLDFLSLLPLFTTSFDVGANPTSIAHRPSMHSAVTGPMAICQLFTPLCPTKPSAFTPPPCWYSGTEQYPVPGPSYDTTGGISNTSYICTRGIGQVEVMNLLTGARPPTIPETFIAIPGVRFVAGGPSQ